MKPFPGLLIFSCLFFSCHNNTEHADTSSPQKKLVSYAEKYPGGAADTVLPGGAYVKFLVNADTADQTLYIRYGKPGIERTYEEEEGIYASNCRDLQFQYSTPNTMALMYECINGRGVLLLPFAAGDTAQYVFPLYMSMEDSLMLVEHVNTDDKPPLLTVADLDFKQQKSFSLHYRVPCADILTCFDTIYFKEKLVMKYEGGAEGREPTTQEQAEDVGWKK